MFENHGGTNFSEKFKIFLFAKKYDDDYNCLNFNCSSQNEATLHWGE